MESRSEKTAKLSSSDSRRADSAPPSVSGPPISRSRNFSSVALGLRGFLVVMLVYFLDKRCFDRAIFRDDVNSPVCLTESNCAVAFPLTAQQVVSKSWDGPRSF